MANFPRLQILQNQVDCRNRLNAESEKFRLQLQEVFSQFIGKKIYKFTDGSLSASVRKAVEPIMEEARGRGFHCWFDASSFGPIYFSVQCSYRTSDVSVDYCKAQFFVACFDRSTGLMTEETRDFIKYRCDYTLEEVTAVRNEIAELEKRISSLKSIIAEFST